MPYRAAVYLRISLDQTGEGLAIDRQREDCYAIAKERGWEVIGEYVDDSISASKQNVQRPEYNRLLQDYAAGRFDALICWDLDRLTRQMRQLEDWIDAAKRKGLALVTANGEADLTTDGGRLFARIKASVAGAEVERKSARQTRAAAQRAERGLPPGGPRLTGYTADHELDPMESVWIKHVFDRFIAGAALTQIGRELTAAGIYPRTKPKNRASAKTGKTAVKPWRDPTVWNPSSLSSYLQNPRYCGRIVYQGKETGQLGHWPAIITEDQFEQAQAILGDPRRKTNRTGTARKWLGSGLWLCAVCDAPVTVTGTQYWCRTKAHITRSISQVDGHVTTLVRARLRRPDILDTLRPAEDDRADDRAAQVNVLRARLAQIESDYDDGVIDGRRYQVATEKVSAELKQLERERARAVSGSALSAVLGTDDPGAAFDDASLEDQRAICSALVEVRLHRGQRGSKVLRPETIEVTPKGRVPA
ncbi:recombinase family protein [Salinibacterium sp. ZJ450]|uniref:recombinase family protein n=1 Tax=Salinibacterium sp. ZJ450 TaxID=2708338 RepID=UPI00141EE237|nr:recombinase family protein [Salinibacterium sp. ZJ450]